MSVSGPCAAVLSVSLPMPPVMVLSRALPVPVNARRAGVGQVLHVGTKCIGE